GKIFVPILKYAIQRPRPIELYSGAETFSFPSGHATMAALIVGILAVLVSHAMGRWSRSLVYATCGVFVIAIAYSRVYLGVHWLSDVLGGLMFGAVMAAAFGVAIEAIPPRRIWPLGLIGFSALVMMGVGGAHVSLDYGVAEEAYGPRQQAVVETYRHWQGGGWKNQPVERIDLAGTAGEAFLAQFVGGADTLRLTLSAAGWQQTPKWTWRDAIPYLNPQASFADLAPRPALHEGLKARLTMVKPIDERTRDVLRVFKTDNLVLLRDRRLPLYLVSLARERDRRSFNLYAVPRPLPARAEDRAALIAFLDANRHFLRITPDAGEAPSAVLFLAVGP
ncbi:MAG: phosphatase PAP2 family protein, partial [Alphaproteobacteria bacterium]|nr:phosphatase PAP2 family protein [Alphaproteobacteria bacterium]